MRKCVLGYLRKANIQINWESTQSDQGLYFPLTESLDTKKCMNGKRKEELRWYFVHVQDDLNLHFLQMFKGTFPLDTAHL